MATRMADPFEIPKDTAKRLHDAFLYWPGKTTSDLATSYMSQPCLDAQANGVFTVGNYYSTVSAMSASIMARSCAKVSAASSAKPKRRKRN